MASPKSRAWQFDATARYPNRWTVRNASRPLDALTVVFQRRTGQVLVTYQTVSDRPRKRTGWLIEATERQAKTMARRFLKDWDKHPRSWKPPRMERPCVTVMPLEDVEALERYSMGLPPLPTNRQDPPVRRLGKIAGRRLVACPGNGSS